MDCETNGIVAGPWYFHSSQPSRVAIEGVRSWDVRLKSSPKCGEKGKRKKRNKKNKDLKKGVFFVNLVSFGPMFYILDAYPGRFFKAQGFAVQKSTIHQKEHRTELEN